MSEPLTNAQIRRLKALAQSLEPMLKVGKNGVSSGLLQSIEILLAEHELVKIKFIEFKDQKKELAHALAHQTSSHLITLVGNIAVLFRRQADPTRRRISLP